MSRYTELFDETAAAPSVFDDKSELDPLTPSERLVARPGQERELATILQGISDGYLPTTVSLYGPPGTGKTTITRRLCEEFAAQTADIAVEYVNLNECRSIFSAANEILVALTDEKKGSYEGLDGVFEAIWSALEAYPEWTVFILDEIDHVRHDANYDVDEFFYRLLRGEGKLSRGINLSVFLLSNELLTVDLRLDSRVESAMSDEEVFFPPYTAAELEAILAPRVEHAFVTGALTDDVFTAGVDAAANRWGDARKALRLFRRAGECANRRGLGTISEECLRENLRETDRTSTIAKLRQLPLRHLVVLTVAVSWRDPTGSIIQPIATSRIHQRLDRPDIADRYRLGIRTVQTVSGELETMGLVRTWTEPLDDGGRGMFVETTFDPSWVRDAQADAAEQIAIEDAQ